MSEETFRHNISLAICIIIPWRLAMFTSGAGAFKIHKFALQPLMLAENPKLARKMAL